MSRRSSEPVHEFLRSVKSSTSVRPTPQPPVSAPRPSRATPPWQRGSCLPGCHHPRLLQSAHHPARCQRHGGPAAGSRGGGRCRLLLSFSLVLWVWWACWWESVGVSYQPSSTVSESGVRPLSRPQLSEARRVRAVELFEQGCSTSEIAAMVGMHAESVRRWRRAWENGGARALRRRSAPGPRPKLDDAQVEEVRAALERGAQAHGFEA
ncbi:helix-turn-helix domain-containing protein, partial [Streptomyces sp. NPDC127033]|uniref:helix-turn-helix domain-containing protein n=1 Tax=Streptomyces sp. NPDC127033 TaxID=3347110 RepID=UPI0036564240